MAVVFGQDYLSEGNAVINELEQLDVFVQVNVDGPLVGNAVEELGEEVETQLAVVRAVHDPLLLDLASHLLVAVERQQNLVNTFHQLVSR